MNPPQLYSIQTVLNPNQKGNVTMAGHISFFGLTVIGIYIFDPRMGMLENREGLQKQEIQANGMKKEK